MSMFNDFESIARKSHKDLPQMDISDWCKHTIPEVSVWRASVLQALIDITTASNKPRYKTEKMRAQKWLLKPSQDFDFVCTTADFDPKFIQQKARALLDKGKKPIAKLSSTKSGTHTVH